MKRDKKNKSFIRTGLIRVILFFIALLSLPYSLSAGGFKVLSFEKVNNDLSAILRQYKRLDDNDETCAIIKVRSDIDDLQFTASTPIIGNVEIRNGEYWIYLSPGTRQLSVFKRGFIKTTYTFPLHIKKASVYSMVITSEIKGYERGKGSLFIDSDPPQAEVQVDGFPDLLKKTPCKFENYRKGVYKFIISKNRHESLDTVVSIERGTTKQIYVKLKPKWGNLKVILADHIPATFTFNGKNYINDTLDLTGEEYGPEPGEWFLRISRGNYYDTTFYVTIRPGKTSTYRISLNQAKELLTINSIPQGAKIYLDDVFMGYTPFSKKVITGNRILKLIHDNYINEIIKTNLIEDNPVSLMIHLRNHKDITIQSVPPGATIFLNGEKRGRTPNTLTVSSGSNELELRKDYYKTFTTQINVNENESYSYRLEKENYKLKIVSKPSEATVIINGEEKGTTPLELIQPYGTYKISLKKEKYSNKRKRIKLKSDKVINVKLPTFMAGYIGLGLVYPESEYETKKIAGEFGWSYRHAPHLLNAIGYAHGEMDVIDGSFFSSVKRINPYNYTDLYLNDIKKVAMAEEKVNVYYARIGIVMLKSTIVLSALGSAYTYEGYYVYEADKNYDNGTGNGTLFQGDLFLDTTSLKSDVSFRYGAGLLIRLGFFYLSGDYWFNDINGVNLSPQYLIGIGVAF